MEESRKEKRIIAIIPVRMAAARFPNKPLRKILGLPMVEHVRRRVSLCDELDDVIVATCDDEIREVVHRAGGKVVMTSDIHERCTDRIAEAALEIEADIIVNVQGDEPLVLPEMLTAVIEPFFKETGLPCVNLVTRITDDTEFNDPNAPKVVTNTFGELLYISREPIPSDKKADSKGFKKLKQLGIIAFEADFLMTYTKLKPTPLEQIESVDMNRAIEHGYRVKIIETDGTMIGVDIPSDIKRVEEILKDDPLLKDYIDM